MSVSSVRQISAWLSLVGFLGNTILGTFKFFGKISNPIKIGQKYRTLYMKIYAHCWSILYILLHFHDNSLNIMYCSQRRTYLNNEMETRCYFYMQNALNTLFTATPVSENCPR